MTLLKNKKDFTLLIGTLVCMEIISTLNQKKFSMLWSFLMKDMHVINDFMKFIQVRSQTNNCKELKEEFTCKFSNMRLKMIWLKLWEIT